MSIVVITLPGDDKKAFVNMLHERTEGKVSLVVVQRQAMPRSFSWKQLSSLPEYLKEGWYALILRLSPKLRKKLEYFRDTTVYPKQDYIPRVLEVDDVNSLEVLEAIAQVQPKVIAVWGSKILSDEVIASAPIIVNLHMGKCPHYRGTLANQHAVLDGSFTKIGATIHHVSPGVDSGNVITVIPAQTALSPKELFMDLHTKARETYIDSIADLVEGKELPGNAQDRTQGKNLLLRNWKPSLRYKVAQQLARREKDSR